jgi:hypothetical protein
MLFAIRDPFIFACSMLVFAVAITHSAAEIGKARRRGESGRSVALREFRTRRVGIAISFGFILLVRSQL